MATVPTREANMPGLRYGLIIVAVAVDRLSDYLRTKRLGKTK